MRKADGVMVVMGRKLWKVVDGMMGKGGEKNQKVNKADREGSNEGKIEEESKGRRKDFMEGS